MLGTKKQNSQGIKKEIVNNKLKCSNCCYSLDISNFHKDKSSSNGYKSYCKVCGKKYKKKKIVSNFGILGVMRNQCPTCKIWYTTKTVTKVFCSAKCRKRDWYLKNEQKKQ